MDDDETSNEYLTPEEITNEAIKALSNLLPEKSRKKYDQAFNNFLAWREKNNSTSFSENTLLAYFNELSRNLKPSTLWSRYSMIRSKLSVIQNINISTYKILIHFLKSKSKGYVAKKAKIFTAENLQKFFTEAPDDKFLVTKIAAIFGINGACRSNELTNISVKDIQQEGEIILVQIPKTKNGVPRSFTIQGEFAQMLLKYQKLRPPNASPNRFFLSMRNGKCTVQPIGINTFSSMPKRIAEYLKLEEPTLYTGHSFRRTSATLLVDAGADVLALKRHGGWKSSSVAEGYIDQSLNNKMKICRQITENIHLPSTSTMNLPSTSTMNLLPSTSTMNFQVSKRQRLNHENLENIENQNFEVPNINLTLKKCTNCTITIKKT